jgi:hypothetical protein
MNGLKVHTLTNYVTIKMQNTFEVIIAVKLKVSSNVVLGLLRDSTVSPCDDGTAAFRIVSTFITKHEVLEDLNSRLRVFA